MSSTLLAQLSDPHIQPPGMLALGRVDTAARLRAAVTSLTSLRPMPDAVVLTGDLVDRGSDAEYGHLRALLAPLPMPVYLMPGNHDDRSSMRRNFPDHAYLRDQPFGRADDGFVQYSVAVGRLRLIALDTSVPGRDHGALCDARLDWLEAELARHDATPVVVALHHPPFPSGLRFMDAIGLRAGAERLAAIVACHPNVERLISGHLHRPIERRFGGTLASTAPAVAQQIHLALGEDRTVGYVLEPPAYRLHRLDDEGTLLSHLVQCGEFGGPQPFG